MPASYRYKIYDYILQSDFLIPELIPAPEGTPDFFVHESETPVALPAAEVLREGELPDEYFSYQLSQTDFLLKIRTVGSYLIRHNRHITVYREPGLSDEDLRLYLLGSCLAFLLQRLGTFSFHGSALSPDGEAAVLFVGPSGVGKSTTAAHFTGKGYRFLSDDVTVVRTPSQGSPLAFPSYPQIKLWEDSARALGVNTGNLATVTPDWHKYRYLVGGQFTASPKLLAVVYELCPTAEVSAPEIQPLQGLEKVAALMRNVYWPEAVEILGLQQDHFRFCAAVAGRVAVKRIRRPLDTFMLAELSVLIEEDIKTCLPLKTGLLP